jgi:hypothetical protein
VNTAPFSSWDDASELIPWGAESFGVWLFLVVAVVAFVAMIARAVQHENACLVRVAEEAHGAETAADGAPEAERLPAGV